MLDWFARKKSTAEGLLGVEVGPEGIALSQVSRPAGKAPQLLRCLFREAQPSAHSATLKALVEEFGLEGMPVNLVMHPAEYQLLLLDCPDVPPDEMRDAMRWRIKDLSTEPLENLVIDTFSLPDDAYRGRSRMAYSAVLGKRRMQDMANLIHSAGLILQSIDITEMAFRNLGLLAGAEGINLALLRLRSSEGLVTIQSAADIYMARRIERGLANVDDDFMAITLEIQRSLDYFESQLGKGYLHRLLLLPLKRDSERAMQAFSNGLAVNLQRLDLRELFPAQAAAALPEQTQAYCLASVGAALRQEIG